jgi:hypothetical protein
MSQIASANIPFSRFLVKMDQALGVATGPEDMPAGEEPGSELGIVVDLAVEGDPDRSVLVAHRGRAAVNVDDRQPSVAQPGGTFEEKAVAVRPSMSQGRRHPGQQFAVGSLPPAIHKSGDSTHGDKTIPDREWKGAEPSLHSRA